jgi:hypothetical protein
MRFLPDFARLNLDAMNESDVREEIVRPILKALGYSNGEQAYIETERTLQYERAFLGHKSAKDPPLRGRADYECGVVSYGRWVVEAKGPNKPLTQDDADQAHTYAAHPEIAADLYLITNGREFRLFQTSVPQNPAFTWGLLETPDRFDILENILGPDAVRKRAQREKIDVGKPLGAGIGSRVKLVGGIITYSEYGSKHPQIHQGLQRMMGGQQVAVRSGELVRTKKGLLRATVHISAQFAAIESLNRAAGIDGLVFESASQYISSDVNHPTIFQNLVGAKINAGTTAPNMGFLSGVTIPFDIEVLAGTEAIGFLRDQQFHGVFNVSYVMKPQANQTQLPSHLKAMLAAYSSANITTKGKFEINFIEA